MRGTVAKRLRNMVNGNPLERVRIQYNGDNGGKCNMGARWDYQQLKKGYKK